MCQLKACLLLLFFYSSNHFRPCLLTVQLHRQCARWIDATPRLHPSAAGEQGAIGGAPSPTAPPGAAAPGAGGVQAPAARGAAETHRATEGAEEAAGGGGLPVLSPSQNSTSLQLLSFADIFPSLLQQQRREREMRRQQEREQRRREQEEKRRIEEMDRRRKEEEERRRAEDEKRRNDREQVSIELFERLLWRPLKDQPCKFRFALIERSTSDVSWRRSRDTLRCYRSSCSVNRPCCWSVTHFKLCTH